MKDVKYFIG